MYTMFFIMAIVITSGTRWFPDVYVEVGGIDAIILIWKYPPEGFQGRELEMHISGTF